MTDSLPQKIAKAALDVGGKLSADKTNSEQRYDYLSADKILSVCGQALFAQGVAVVPEITGQETNLFEYTDQYGKNKRRYDSRVAFAFKITDGTGELVQLWYGMGSDYTVPDKALYKAITSGHKYFLMKLLCVGAGNEDSEHDSDENGAKAQRSNGKQAQKPAEQAQPPAQTQPVQPAQPPAPAVPTNGNGHKPPTLEYALAMEVKGRSGAVRTLESMDIPTLQAVIESTTKADVKLAAQVVLEYRQEQQDEAARAEMNYGADE